MIVGIGNDLVNIDRIQNTLNRHGERFEERCFTPYERKKAQTRKSKNGKAAFYAKRFAAKEACAKALGTGFANGIRFSHIGVIEDQNGRPFITITDAAQKQIEAITPKNHKSIIHLSLSDDPPFAQAFVIIEALPH